MGAPIMRLESGRQPDDCAVWALSTYLGVPYKKVWKAVLDIHPRGTFKGMHTGMILRVAKNLGHPLKRVKAPDITEDSYGILSVDFKRSRSGHTAVLRNGLVFDIDQTVWELQPWLDNSTFRIEFMLTED